MRFTKYSCVILSRGKAQREFSKFYHIFHIPLTKINIPLDMSLEILSGIKILSILIQIQSAITLSSV